MTRWFRMYDDLLNDPKVQRLPPPLFKMWVNLLCAASKHDGRIPPLADLAFMLRASEKSVGQDVDALISAGLLDETNAGLMPHNWSGRQFHSDNSTQRVQRFRNARRNVSPAVSETSPDTEQKQITEQIPPVGPPKGARATKAKGEFLDPDWKPDEDLWAKGTEVLGTLERARSQFERFQNHFLSRSGEVARKRDWPRALVNWWLRAADELSPEERAVRATTGPPQPPGPGLPTEEQLREKARKLNGSAGKDAQGNPPETEAVRPGSAVLRAERGIPRPPVRGSEHDRGDPARHRGMAALGDVLPMVGLGAKGDGNGAPQADQERDDADEIPGMVRH